VTVAVQRAAVAVLGLAQQLVVGAIDGIDAASMSAAGRKAFAAAGLNSTVPARVARLTRARQMNFHSPTINSAGSVVAIGTSTWEWRFLRRGKNLKES
jgi:hypothetical protein